MAVLSNGTRLGTQRRKELNAAYNARGHLCSELVYAYSPRMGQDVVLKSKLEYWHFILAEADPRIDTIKYNPSRKGIAHVDDDNIGTLFDADIRLKDGSRIWREIKYSEDRQSRSLAQQKAQEELAHQHGVTYERITEKDIFKNGLLISNWIEVVSWLTSIRGYPSLQFDIEVSRLLLKNQTISVQELISVSISKNEQAHYLAAAFRLLQLGKVFSDLDSAPLTTRTRLSKVAPEAGK